MSHSQTSIAIVRAPGLPASSRRLGLWLLGQAAAHNGAAVLPLAAVRAQLGGVSFGRVRVGLAPLVEAGIVHYTSAKIGADCWIFVVFLAWLPRLSAASLVNAASDPGVEVTELSDRAVSLFVSDLSSNGDPTNKQTAGARTSARTRTREDIAGGVDFASEAARVAAALDDNGRRVYGLLVDPAVGFNPSTAYDLAARGLDFWIVAGNVFGWLRDCQAGRLRQPKGALIHRLVSDFRGDILPEDRKLPLWDRYCLDAPGAPVEVSPYDPASVDPLYHTRNLSDPVVERAAAAASSVQPVQPAISLASVASDPAPAVVLWDRLLDAVKHTDPAFARDWLIGNTSPAALDGDRLTVEIKDPRSFDWLSTRGKSTIKRWLVTLLSSRTADVVFIAAPAASAD